jgi:phytoene dehydrogenase-like protein
MNSTKRTQEKGMSETVHSDSTWDYIVIGGGHNGMSAACRLAQDRASVVVVEQLPILGGLSASHAYLPEAPNHLLSMGAMDDMFMSQTRLTSDYRLADFGYIGIPLDAPYGWMNEEGDTLLLFKDFGRTLEEIRYFSPKDAATYEAIRPAIDWIIDLQDKYGALPPSAMGKFDIAKLALGLVRDKKLRKMLGRMLSASMYELISETFESDAMRGLWAFWTGMIVPGDMDGTGLYLSAFGAVHRGGVRRPQGGMSGLITAFHRLLESLGGHVRVGQSVERILVDHNRATGVQMKDGTRLMARRGVLASCAPQVTLGELLAEGVLDRKTRDSVRYMPANYLNVAPFKIDSAVGGRLTYTKAERRRQGRHDAVDIRKTTFMTGTLEDHMAQLHAMKGGRNIPNPPVYMAILSAADPTIAPAGQDVLYLHSNAPAEPVEGWPSSKAIYSRAIRSSANRFLDGMSAEIGAVETTPADFERRFSTPKGCYFHVDMIPTRMGSNRPAPGLGGYVTPVTALYLAGAGVHPGGGVNGWPGRLAAERALQD